MEPIRAGKRMWMAGVLAGLALMCSCVPVSPGSPVTALEVQTLVTRCGGVIPPPGEPWCHTSPASTVFEVTQRGAVVAAGTTDADGRAVVEVPAGSLSVHAANPPIYMECDSVAVTAVEGETTPVTQTCTFYAP